MKTALVAKTIRKRLNEKRGMLLVFEGPDGVGKTTLAKGLTIELNKKGFLTHYYSFPGKEKETLGSLIYQLHHDPLTFGIKKVDSASLQLLHIAAHLDCISTRIIPDLSTGYHVVLDRYWWSTLVYGITNGIDKAILRLMIEIERRVWRRLLPDLVLHLHLKRPFVGTATLSWLKLSNSYHQLSKKESLKYDVVNITQEDSPANILESLLHRLEPMILKKSSKGNRGLMLNTVKQELYTPHIFSKLSPLKPTVVYDTYWRFAAERQNIFFKKMSHLPPWTDDDILRQYKFTNAYRAADRVSQYLIQNVICTGEQSQEELFFRIMFFKIFNKISTWEMVLEQVGNISFSTFSQKQYDSILSSAILKGCSIYSAAYIMPSGGKNSKFPKKHKMHLSLLDKMMKDKLPSRIADCTSMGKAFEMLRAYPSIGDFLAYQYVTDLNYSSLINFSERDFVVAGPGARDGIRKCFTDYGGLSEAEIIKIVEERQDHEFRRLGLEFKNLWGRKLQLIDCQNLFCEVDKYSRIKHPEYIGLTGRTRIKQKYHWNPTPIDYYFPPKWGINEKARHAP